MTKVIQAMRELHQLLKITKEFPKPDGELVSYDIAHHAGLSLSRNTNCSVCCRKSSDRNTLKRHLGNVLPVIAEMETLKEKVKLNGHFKNLFLIQI